MPLYKIASNYLIRINRYLRSRLEFIRLELRKANLLLYSFIKEPSDKDL